MRSRIQEEAGFLLVELRKTKGMCDPSQEGYQETGGGWGEGSVTRRWALVGESLGVARVKKMKDLLRFLARFHVKLT